jgi:hypothetical protein
LWSGSVDLDSLCAVSSHPVSECARARAFARPRENLAHHARRTGWGFGVVSVWPIDDQPEPVPDHPAEWRRGLELLVASLVGMSLGRSIGVFAVIAYGLLIAAALLLPKTKGRLLTAEAS